MAEMTIEMRGVDEAAKMLEGIPRGIKIATNYAINRGFTAARTAVSTTVRDKYEVKAKEVKRVIRKVRRKDGMTIIVHKDQRLPLGAFKTYAGNKTKYDRKTGEVKTRGGGSYRIEKGGDKKRIPGSFKVKGISNNLYIRKLEGDKEVGRGPFVTLKGLSIVGMISLGDLEIIIATRFNEIFEKRIIHEAEQVIERHIARNG